MKLGICNFIFPKLSKETKLNIIETCDCIDFAPTIENIKWNNNKKITFDYQELEISCIQSITYGVSDLSLVQTENKFINFENHFLKVCELANKLNAKGIIYGSPSTRCDIEIDKRKIYQRLLSLTDLAKEYNLEFFVEAVSRKFGNEYISKTKELIDIVEFENKLNLHIDVGLLIEEKFNLEHISENLIKKVKHIHLATPDLNLPNSSQFKVWLKIIDIFKNQNIPIIVEIQNLSRHDEKNLLNLMNNIRGYIS